MLRILIAYDTTEGQTRKIALHLAEAISRSNQQVQVIDIRRPPSGFTLDCFDAIIVGASIHPKGITMPHKKLPRNASCPCGSGKKYRDCCYDKSFEYVVDEDGTILKSLPMSAELAEVIEEQKRKFQEEHGREIGPNDKLFFDVPPLEHVEHYMVEAMKKAGLDPAIIYAFEKTGLLVTEENQHLLPEKDLAEWEAAIAEYEALQENDELPEEDGNEWF